MEIRHLSKMEWDRAFTFTAQLFPQAVGFAYTKEGQDDFYNNLNRISTLPEGEIHVFEAQESSQTVGVSVMTAQGNILFIIVSPNWRNRNIERMLVNEMKNFADAVLQGVQLTMEAPEGLMVMLKKAGLDAEPGRGRKMGMTYVKMNAIKNKPVDQKNKQVMILVGIAAGVAIFCIIAVLIIMSVFFVYRITSNQNNGLDNYEQGTGDDYDYGYDGDEDDSDDSGTYDGEKVSASTESLYDINCYKADNLSYTIETVSDNSKSTDKLIQVDFDGEYPQVKDLPSGKDEEVNQVLKNQALYTKNKYESASENDVSSFESENPQITSKVGYVVSYADEKLLSVVYEDRNWSDGNELSEAIQLRSCIINLETAEIYESKYIIKPTYSLAKDIRTKLIERYEDFDNLKSLDVNDYEDMLTAETSDDMNYITMFLSEDGIQFAFSYRVVNGEAYECGWRIVAFTSEEMENYKTSSPFWTFIS